MPVETGRSGGEFSRHYRGGTHLGVALQWDCPACGTKHESAAHPIEQGCPSCGAGVPGRAGSPPSQPPPAPVSDPVTRPRPEVHPRPSVPERVGVLAAPGMAAAPEEGILTVHRLIAYTGSKAWIEATLRRSLVGYMDLGNGLVTATIVDDVSTRQQDLMNMARRQPGVWMSHPPESEVGGFDSRRGLAPLPRTQQVVGKVGSLPTGAVMTTPVTPKKETPPMPDRQLGPNTAEMAEEIIRGVGSFQGAYTIAMALNQFATVVEDESMERDKFWSPQQCLGVAQALLNRIPKDWQPEPAEEPADGQA